MEYPDISKLKVPELKSLCSDYGLLVSGRKADLQERLTIHFSTNPLSEATPAEAEENKSEPDQVESEKSDSHQPDPEQVDSELSPPDKAEAEKSDSDQPDPEQVDSEQSPPDKAEAEKSDSDQPDPEQADSEQSRPSEADSEKSESDQAEPDQAEPIQAEAETTVDQSDPEEIKDEKSPEETAPIEEEEIDEEVKEVLAAENLKTEDTPQNPVLEDNKESNLENVKSETQSMEVDEKVAEEPEKENDNDDKMDIKAEENEKEDDDEVVEVPTTKAGDKTRKSRWGTGWTKEAPDVKIGQMVSAPAEAPEPVPKLDEQGNKLTKAQRKALKKKRRKVNKKLETMDSGVETGNDSGSDKKDNKGLTVDIDYIAEEPEFDQTSIQFKKVFDAFRAAQFIADEQAKKTGYESKPGEVDAMIEGDSDEEDKQGESTDKISKKKLKKQSRLTVAELKQIVERPDLVEMHDVTSLDPKLLILMKSCRNSVAVPRHWSYKRKYLSGKRGIEKPPFELPEFIKKTGIMEMREALQQKEQEQSMKTKMRQRVRPKLGKIDIDYQKLHDAFFRYQTKPKMSRHGDIYYEGKEYETRLRELKPGELTDDLRTALGMPLGNNASKVPPPWLIAMQRYGPPPSYPNLKIPGLNAPIPPGCSFGYHAGGWGKPPVDERGRPLYGDVFGVDSDDKFEAEKPSETLWGDMESDSDSSDDEDSDAEESVDEGDQDGTGVPTLVDPATFDNGMATPSGLASAVPVPETPTPGEITLRKAQSDVNLSNPPPLYTVLQEQKAPVGKGMMGTSHVYDLKGTKPGAEKGTEVSINPEDLELDPAQIAAKYQSKTEGGSKKEDMSDMMSEHLNRTARDRKRKQTAKDSDQKSKKYKDFKF